MLSAYEFARHFDFKQASHPIKMQGHAEHQQEPSRYHAALTGTGVKLAAKGKHKELIAGRDYKIREEGEAGSWLPLGNGMHAQPYRHDWVLVPRKRPHVPVIYGAQGVDLNTRCAVDNLWVGFFCFLQCACQVAGRKRSRRCAFWSCSFPGSTMRQKPHLKCLFLEMCGLKAPRIGKKRFSGMCSAAAFQPRTLVSPLHHFEAPQLDK